jgi:hypothetical protein
MLVILVCDERVQIRHNVLRREVNPNDEQSVNIFVGKEFNLLGSTIEEILFIENDTVIKRY